MEWRDTGIVLGARRHGESAAILEVLTENHGRHMGLVRGARSKNLRSFLQTGNTLKLQWRARLSEHLGNFTVEPDRSRAADLLDNPLALAGVRAVAALASAALPEREPHAPLFHGLSYWLDTVEDESVWPALLVRWELALINELGFGLDFSCCAATGTTEDLIYVSPKSGRAVSREGGAAYKDKMLPLPGFLLSSQNADPTAQDVLDGFRMTEYFIARHVLAPHQVDLPETRQHFLGLLQRNASVGAN